MVFSCYIDRRARPVEWHLNVKPHSGLFCDHRSALMENVRRTGNSWRSFSRALFYFSSPISPERNNLDIRTNSFLFFPSCALCCESGRIHRYDFGRFFRRFEMQSNEMLLSLSPKTTSVSAVICLISSSLTDTL